MKQDIYLVNLLESEKRAGKEVFSMSIVHSFWLSKDNLNLFPFEVVV